MHTGRVGPPRYNWWHGCTWMPLHITRYGIQHFRCILAARCSRPGDKWRSSLSPFCAQICFSQAYLNSSTNRSIVPGIGRKILKPLDSSYFYVGLEHHQSAVPSQVAVSIPWHDAREVTRYFVMIIDAESAVADGYSPTVLLIPHTIIKSPCTYELLIFCKQLR